MLVVRNTEKKGRDLSRDADEELIQEMFLSNLGPVMLCRWRELRKISCLPYAFVRTMCVGRYWLLVKKYSIDMI